LDCFVVGEIRFEKALGKKIIEIESESVKDTVEFGTKIMKGYLNKLSGKPVILALSGELGSGKTQFVKGVAIALDIEEIVQSPTFTIIDEYLTGVGNLVHIDTWRVADSLEFDRLRIKEHIKPGNVIAIEWADKFFNEIEEMLVPLQNAGKAIFLKIKFQHISKDKRKITVYR